MATADRADLRLRDRLKGRWPMWADGSLSCPVCGASVHPSAQDVHTTWHEIADPIFNNPPPR